MTLGMLENAETVEFFLVALPGLEDVVRAEVAAWCPGVPLKVEHGGVTARLPLAQGLGLNLALKTPTRILLRVAHFRCRDFPKLYNKINSLPWRQWIDPRVDLSVNVATRLSRLKIKSRIAETCHDGWQEYQKRQGIEKTDYSRSVGLYVRFLNDECTLSLDTSGERLHKRGDRQHIGEAPLRETIAAALIQWVARDFSEGGAEAVTIVDPMAGSGTFLLEAAGRQTLVSKREFAFTSFASEAEAPTVPVKSGPEFTQLVGYEKDRKSMTAAKANLQRAGLKAELRAEDFFTAEPLPVGPRRWLFVNPPYGERLQVREPLLDFYVKLFAAAERVVHPERACVLLPAKIVKGKFELPPRWKVLAKRPFVNGGIPVVAFVFGRKDVH